MSCLNDARIQAVADGEATQSEVDHLQTCSACRTRVNEAQADVREFAQQMSSVSVPPMLGARVASAAARDASPQRAGATTLREPASKRVRPAWIIVGSAMAAAILILFVIFPSFDPRTRLNAAEILNRSLETLAGTGVEMLKYELSIDAPRTLPTQNGTFVVEQLIDHDTGRWRFSRVAADGTLVSALAEDPAAGRREAMIVEGGRTFRFMFTLGAGEEVPLWDLERRYAEAMIRLIQVSRAEVGIATGPSGEKQYVVELPDDGSRTGSPLFDLNRARVVVDATDFHIVEFSAAGSAVGEQVSVGYRLIEHRVWDSAPADVTFDLPAVDGGAIVLQGDGTKHIAADFLSLLLREVAAGR
jgi:hypothetical protein